MTDLQLANQDAAPGQGDVASENVMIISVDSHVGPPLEVLRDYCATAYLDEFDAFTKEFNAAEGVLGITDFDMFNEDYVNRLMETLSRPLMQYDPYERLNDMDADGIAAEVVYHGCLNGVPIPFASTFGVASLPTDTTTRAADLAAEGMRIYNRWLSDYCSVAPDRRCGLAQLPVWNMEMAVADLRTAHKAGLRGINLPAPRPGMAGHNNMVWDPLWSVCAELEVSLNTHGGSGVVDTDQLIGVNTGALLAHEVMWWSRRILWFMILGSVFDRHPSLKLVLTEQPGGWVMPALRELDSIKRDEPAFKTVGLEKTPTEYFHSNCYIGASFMSKDDTADAEAYGFTDRLMWGADYPHPEGTFPLSTVSLRMALEGVKSDDSIKKMLGENAADVFGFDKEALAPVAAKIGPTLAELRTPVPANEVPQHTGSMGFRQGH